MLEDRAMDAAAAAAAAALVVRGGTGREGLSLTGEAAGDARLLEVRSSADSAATVGSIGWL